MKSGNEYAEVFGRLYAAVPKSVFAAVAYSFAVRIAEEPAAVGEFLNEWRILHEQGIVPQRPPKGGDL